MLELYRIISGIITGGDAVKVFLRIIAVFFAVGVAVLLAASAGEILPAILMTVPDETTNAVSESSTMSQQIETPTAEEILSSTVFVGDSICSGLRVYGYLPADSVLAEGNIGAWSIFNYEFTVAGQSYPLGDALRAADPDYVVFSMGMNDVNMGSETDFCNRYDAIIAVAKEAVPGARLYVASITPISQYSNFCSNERIDLFNRTLADHLAGSDCTFLDIASAMKGSGKGLPEEMSGGDGIHLSRGAYQVILDRFCEEVIASYENR